MRLEPGAKLDRFTVKGELGRGGMSDVFVAYDPVSARDVVLKFPHPDLLGDPKTHEHFNREVQIGKLLDHPNIQKLYELAGDPRDPYLVLEYVPGVTLRDEMESPERKRSVQPLSDRIDEAVRLGGDIAGALAYAHSQHVAHRDLKPENVIVMADGRAKVMDFGVAYIEGARRVTWGALSAQVGTPDYMAPEQIRGVRGDHRTDIYAVGMMLYEMIALRLPYEGDNALAIMSQHVNENAKPIHAFVKGVPSSVEEIVMKAIRRSPDDRWQSMNELSEALANSDAVNAAALKAEREAMPASDPELKGLSREIGMPVWKVLLIVVAIFAGAIAFGLIAQAMHAGSNP